MIHFVFEIIKGDFYRNFSNCKDLNESGIFRFTKTPLVNDLKLFEKTLKVNYTNKIPQEGSYIISSGVMHSPDFWAGEIPKIVQKSSFNMFISEPQKTRSKNKNLFEFLNKNYLSDLQSNRAFLLLDQTHEGYHENWLWDWFHRSCNEYRVSPKQIIYLTGNLKAKKQYRSWCKNNLIKEKIKVIPYATFEVAISKSLNNENHFLPSLENHIEYKIKNKDSIRLYNCLQKRPRPHRAWLFNALRENDLLSCGINTMNKFVASPFEGITMSQDCFIECNNLLPILPRNDKSHFAFVDGDCGEYLSKINYDVTLDTYISIVSESLFSESSLSCFLSEKTFKPIASRHPFIIFGNKHSLKYLKSLGYKTFHPFINESYDDMSGIERAKEIIKELQRLSQKNHKEWINTYKEITDILNHNFNLLSKQMTQPRLSIKSLISFLHKYQ
jgi:hypothetical protein